MEDSPLTLAHQHAQTATNLLASSNKPHKTPVLQAAASAHALAASSFAAAAKTTKDAEAQRLLSLMVAEHERWAQQLRAQAEHPAADHHLRTVLESDEAAAAPSPGKPPPLAFATPPAAAAPPPPPHYPARLQKSTSSLATNLANARGIPQSQPALSRNNSSTAVPSARRRGSRQGAGAPGTPTSETAPTAPASSKPTTNPLSLLPPDQPSPPPVPPGPQSPGKQPASPSAVAAAEEESFNKFYSGLNTLITRIGSPFTASLAFAGLQVGDAPEDNEIKGSGADLLPRGWTEGRGRGRLEDDAYGGESFFYVPTGGGTLSYASVARRENSGGPPGASGDRGGTGSGGKAPEEQAQFEGHPWKSLEELKLENVTLRHSLETLTRKIAAYQRGQRETEHMMKSSFMGAGGGGGARDGVDILSQVQRGTWLPHEMDEDAEVFSEGRQVGEIEAAKEARRELEARVRRLEEELGEGRREMRRLFQDNERLRKQVEQFKDRWKKLEEKAKKRERERAGSGSNAALKREEAVE